MVSKFKITFLSSWQKHNPKESGDLFQILDGNWRIETNKLNFIQKGFQQIQSHVYHYIIYEEALLDIYTYSNTEIIL